MNTFYTNWVEGSNGGYGQPISTFEQAKKEAERLAQLPGNLGKRVRVLQCLGTVVYNPTTWEPCDSGDLPF